MSESNWQRKINEVIERLKTRYGHIGSKTGVRFLAVIYPLEIQDIFFNEWQTHSSASKSELEIHNIDVLKITQEVIDDLGVENIIDSIDNPLPGSDPENELGQLWINSIVNAVFEAFEKSSSTKPVVCLSQFAALYPAAGPRSVMQTLWGTEQNLLKGPVILLIPGSISGPRTYTYLGVKEEFMYRGDLL